MKKNWILVFILALIVGSQIPLMAAARVTDLTGLWNGAINLPGMELGITVDFSRDSSGGLKGAIDIPLQGAKGLPLKNITVEGDNVTFEIVNVPGAPTFKGVVEPDGDSITGNFTQSGQTYSFSLSRKGKTEIEQQAKSLNEKLIALRAFIDSTMKIWKVPGLAMAIVKDGMVLFSEGYGKRNVKDSLPVTPITVFAIGSATKAFTTMVIGILADSGKVDWDKTVRTYIPNFKLKDQFASERMTLRDLVTHRSGLPRHDMVWYGNNSISRKELVERLQYLEPNKDFRTDFQYQNLMFATAGYAVEQATGKSWEENIRTLIFAPLGMTGSNCSVAESQQAADFARPYREEDSLVKEIPFRNLDLIGPAGSINSNLADMTKWVKFHLNKGKVGDIQLISPAGFAQMQLPYMTIAAPLQYTELSHSAYGLGWMIDDYRGHNRVHHGGNIDGFSSLVSLYPQDNLGIVVLTNMDGTPEVSIAADHAADLMLGMEPVDWNSRLRMQYIQIKEAQKKSDIAQERKPGTKPSHKMEDYAGEYENSGYGLLEVSYDGKNLSAVFNGITALLEHWHYDIFRANVKEVENANLLFNFQTNTKGDIDRLLVPLEPTVSEIAFVRKASPEMKNPKFLAKFVGEYEIMGQISRFDLKRDSALVLTVTGQPPYDLTPYKGNEFNLKGLSGFSVEFILDKEGKAISAVFKQPNGIFTATRKK
ncbi:MAG: serine hydrolase [candidate division Zixibacteria bacterium]|nr:serine hydrolase [candidate division Zixibacteria bacterium]